MGEFRFKRFTVSNERSAMKVNTDGVLLGASVTLRADDKAVLDIGTGTGTIALMAAQRLSDLKRSAQGSSNEFSITGIDVDKDSADEAAMNFSVSPWTSSLRSLNVSLGDYLASASAGGEDAQGFDVIVSNPPYFEGSLKAPDERRCNARHSDSMSYRDIFQAVDVMLRPSGRVSLILPSEQEAGIIREAGSWGFYLFRIVRVRTVPHKAPSRMIVEFSRHRGPVVEETLTLQEKGTYTEQYKSLVKEFLLIS